MVARLSSKLLFFLLSCPCFLIEIVLEVLNIHPPTCLFKYSPPHQFIHSPIYPSAYPSVHLLSIYPSIYPLTHLFIHPSTSIHPPMYPLTTHPFTISFLNSCHELGIWKNKQAPCPGGTHKSTGTKHRLLLLLVPATALHCISYEACL